MVESIRQQGSDKRHAYSSLLAVLQLQENSRSFRQPIQSHIPIVKELTCSCKVSQHRVLVRPNGWSVSLLAQTLQLRFGKASFHAVPLHIPCTSSPFTTALGCAGPRLGGAYHQGAL